MKFRDKQKEMENLGQLTVNVCKHEKGILQKIHKQKPTYKNKDINSQHSVLLRNAEALDG